MLKKWSNPWVAEIPRKVPRTRSVFSRTGHLPPAGTAGGSGEKLHQGFSLKSSNGPLFARDVVKTRIRKNPSSVPVYALAPPLRPTNDQEWENASAASRLDRRLLTSPPPLPSRCGLCTRTLIITTAVISSARRLPESEENFSSVRKTFLSLPTDRCLDNASDASMPQN